jgi:hypothetical protein
MACTLLLDGASDIAVVGTSAAGGIFTLQKAAGKTLETLVPTIHQHLAQQNLTLADVAAFLVCEGPGFGMGLRVCKMVVDTFQVMRPRCPVFSYNRLELAAWEGLAAGYGPEFRLVYPLPSRNTAVLAVANGVPGQPNWLVDYIPRDGDREISSGEMDWEKMESHWLKILRTRRSRVSFTPFIPLPTFQKMG